MINNILINYKTVNDNKSLVLTISGDFLIDNLETLSFQEVIKKIESLPNLVDVSFDLVELQEWDSSILTFLNHIKLYCLSHNIAFIKDSLPKGVERVLNLAEAVPERKGVRKIEAQSSFFADIGDRAVKFTTSAKDMLDFIGEVTVAFTRLIFGRYKIRGSILMPIIRECSVGALPIVSLISCLVGLILAFVGAVQLVMFGAQIYVASLVGIAMIRVMGAVMAGVIMAGRTGAAFAAQLGTMQVNEEIDALKTLGISPVEFLVVPRVLALSIIMPMLCVYADLMGVLGGMIVGIFMLDLNFMEYYNMTRDSVSLNSFWIGVFQSFVFGVLVALAGCLRGMQCKRSASAVGEAATSAVVTAIVSIVVATAIITVLCNVLGI
ncbi:MAG: ABC transporter permease [Desulfamplus sp.]|nr:ABC transporter permease [Desulfamplus sp.]